RTFELQTSGNGCSLSSGERVRVRGNSVASFRHAFIWPVAAILRHLLGCSFLQRLPNRIAHHLFLAPQSRVPEAKHFHAARLEPHITFRVSRLLFRKSVTSSIKLDVQRRFEAKEIEDVRTERVLPAKFVGGEAPVSQPAPHQLLGPRV